MNYSHKCIPNAYVSEKRKKCLGCSTFGHGCGRASLRRPRSRNLASPLFSDSFLEVATDNNTFAVMEVRPPSFS